MDNFIEKRHHIRVPLTYVSVDILNTAKEVEANETCSVADISISGLRFVSQTTYTIGQVIRLTFILPGSTIPIRSDAAVVYQVPNNALLHTGIQFTNLGLAELALLKAYIESVSWKN